MPLIEVNGSTVGEGSDSIIATVPMMSGWEIAFHVVVVTILSNLGKLAPMFFYRDRSLTEPEIDDSLIREEQTTAENTDPKPAAQDTWLYMGVGVVAVAIIAVIAWLVMKKKKIAAGSNK